MSSPLGEGDTEPVAGHGDNPDDSTALSGTVAPIPDDSPGPRLDQTAEPRAEEVAQELAAELAQAKADRDAALAALDKQGRRDRRHLRARHILVGVLVVI